MAIAVPTSTAVKGDQVADPVAQVIKNVAMMHRIMVETTLANKFCPRLKVDENARTLALVKLGGREDRAAALLGAFNETSQADAFLTEKKELFTSKIVAGRDLACEMARLAFGVGGGQVAGLLLPR